MKNLDSLQKKLDGLIKRQSALKIYPGYPWEPQNFEAVVAIVQDFVNNSGEVINDADALADWLCEWKFYKASQINQKAV